MNQIPEALCSQQQIPLFHIPCLYAAAGVVKVRGVRERELVGTAFSHFLGGRRRSHTFVIVKLLEDVHFCSDFLGVVSNVT